MSFFVYIDETLEQSPRVFYVGKGNAERVGRRDRNVHWRRIAAKYGWNRRIVLETESEPEAYELEVALIRLHGTFEGDPEFGLWGANKTSGGDGRPGYEMSIEQRQELSVLKVGNSHALGYRHTEATKQKMRGPKKLTSSGKAALAAARKAGIKLNAASLAEVQTSRLSHRELAALYGVSVGTIWRVINRPELYR